MDDITQNFTDLLQAIEYIVQHAYGCKSVYTHLNSLTLNTGEIITNMPIFRYMVVRDIEDRCKQTLNDLEFRDGPVYDFISINRFNSVVIHRNAVLGVVASIYITVTLRDLHPFVSGLAGTPYGDKNHDQPGEFELKGFHY